jgi:flagellar protein FlbD
MIKLTRLDGQAFILNADLIRYVEQRPDTFVTLLTGDRVVVSEPMDQVVQLAIEYQQRKAMLPSLMPLASPATSTLPATPLSTLQPVPSGDVPVSSNPTTRAE